MTTLHTSGFMAGREVECHGIIFLFLKGEIIKSTPTNMLPIDFFAWLSQFVKNIWILIFSTSSLYLRFIEVHICRLWQDWKVSRSWQSVKSSPASPASPDLKIKCWLCSGQTEDLSLANCSCDVREEAAGQGALSNQEIILSVNTLSGAPYGSCQASQATAEHSMSQLSCHTQHQPQLILPGILQAQDSGANVS